MEQKSSKFKKWGGKERRFVIEFQGTEKRIRGKGARGGGAYESED